jgi:hypothetical protein
VITNMLLLCQNTKGAPKDIPSCNNNKKSKDPLLWLPQYLGPRKAAKKLREIDAYFVAAHAFAVEENVA